ncbi:hypothetical protein BDV98DRAFT_598653 [Pterulicium gracile]|uniref:Uncharacterized protein n=1 Tax=Pterulicium gracile TaxID=1884261 RepID=A0A5C3Q581_9AGAR|nr:hypothetical protein BDV98DRAFT_598653 [Pterula gracilis]
MSKQKSHFDWLDNNHIEFSEYVKGVLPLCSLPSAYNHLAATYFATHTMSKITWSYVETMVIGEFTRVKTKAKANQSDPDTVHAARKGKACCSKKRHNGNGNGNGYGNNGNGKGRNHEQSHFAQSIALVDRLTIADNSEPTPTLIDCIAEPSLLQRVAAEMLTFPASSVESDGGVYPNWKKEVNFARRNGIPVNNKNMGMINNLHKVPEHAPLFESDSPPRLIKRLRSSSPSTSLTMSLTLRT